MNTRQWTEDLKRVRDYCNGAFSQILGVSLREERRTSQKEQRGAREIPSPPPSLVTSGRGDGT